MTKTDVSSTTPRSRRRFGSIELVGGTDKIGADLNPAPGQAYRDMANGEICAMITLRLAAGYRKTYAAELAGKVAMPALPADSDPEDARTASWGADDRHSAAARKNQQLYGAHSGALYLDPEGSITAERPTPSFRRFEITGNDEIYQRPIRFFLQFSRSTACTSELGQRAPAAVRQPFTTFGTACLSDCAEPRRLPESMRVRNARWTMRSQKTTKPPKNLHAGISFRAF